MIGKINKNTWKNIISVKKCEKSIDRMAMSVYNNICCQRDSLKKHYPGVAQFW